MPRSRVRKHRIYSPDARRRVFCSGLDVLEDYGEISLADDLLSADQMGAVRGLHCGTLDVTDRERNVSQ